MALPDQPAVKVLTRRDPEPAGEHCPNGGAAIRAGSDRNGDGVLDDGEVEHTDYVCNGPTAVLIRKDPIDPEVGCPTGGTAVQTGIDVNGDGILEDPEITQTMRLCSPAELWEGDFAATDWADPRKVAALQGVHVVAGALAIIVDAPVSLPALEVVTGDLHVQTGLSGVELPALRVVDGNASIVATADVAAALPALERIGGDLFVNGNSGTSQPVDAPGLRDVAGSVRLGQASTALTLPGLRTIGGDLAVNGPLTTLRLDGLRSVAGAIRLASRSSLRFALPSLQTIGGDLATLTGFVTEVALPAVSQIGGSVVLEGHDLTSISIPSAHTIGGDLLIAQVQTLTTLELGTTEIGGTLFINSAFALATLAMPQLVRVHGGGELTQASEISETNLEVLDFASLREIDRLVVRRCPKLAEVRLPALTTVSDLEISSDDLSGQTAPTRISAPALASIERLIISGVGALDLGGLTSVTGTLQVSHGSLADLSGLRNLASAHVLRIWQIDQLQDLRSLVSLRAVGSLQIVTDPAITSLAGLEPLTELPIALELDGDLRLTDLAALRNVTQIGAFQTEGDPALRDLAFPSLTAITGNLTITGMASLQDLSGLGAVRSVAGDLTFLVNAQLSDDEIAAFRHQVGR